MNWFYWPLFFCLKGNFFHYPPWLSIFGLDLFSCYCNNKKVGKIFTNMARLISNMVLKSLNRNSMSSMVPLASSLQTAKCSSQADGSSGIHEAIQPINQNSGITELESVRKDVEENAVMIYMKGRPHEPRCGFSALAVKVLQLYGVPVASRNILADMELKEAVKAYSNWPTFPQVFIKGEFVGGSDILLTMHQKGELKELFKDLMPGPDQNQS